MEIQIGKTYINKTHKYLRPALKLYGPTFVAKFNLFFKLAYGLHDTLLDGTPIEHQKAIFVLIDKFVQPAVFEDSLNWMRNQEYYITDYPHISLDSRLHMLVIDFPEQFTGIYDKFIESKYSEMYCFDELESFFPEDSEVKDVLIKSIGARKRFVKQCNEAFGSNIVDFEKGQKIEYDFPLSKKEEYFNFKG